MDLDPNATPETLTSLPGTLAYMPPEAQGTEGSSVTYGPTLDVFSFGHLSLFTVTQKPVPLLPPTYHDHLTGKVHGRSEVERREIFIEKAEQLLSGNPSLVVMIKQCLHNNPAQRPHTRELLTGLKGMVAGEWQWQPYYLSSLSPPPPGLSTQSMELVKSVFPPLMEE